MTTLEGLLTEIVLRGFHDPMVAVFVFGMWFLAVIFLNRVSGGAGFVLAMITISGLAFVSSDILLPLKGLMYAATGAMVTFGVLRMGGQA